MRTLAMSSELQLMEHLQLAPFKLSCVTVYETIFNTEPYWSRHHKTESIVSTMRVMLSVFTDKDQPSNLTSKSPSEAPITIVYQVTDINILLSKLPCFGCMQDSFDGSQMIFVSPRVYKSRDASIQPARVTIGNSSRLRAFVLGSLRAGRGNKESESRPTRIEGCIGRRADWLNENSIPALDIVARIRDRADIGRQLAWASHSVTLSEASRADDSVHEHAGAEFGPDHKIWSHIKDGDRIILRAWPHTNDWRPPLVRLELKTQL